MRGDEGDDAERQWFLLVREFFSNRFGKAKIEGTSSRAKTGKVCGWATIGRRTKFSSERRSDGSRWDADLIKNMQGTPQQPDPKRPGVGIPIKVRFSEPAHVDEAIPNQPARQEQGPRRMRIMPYMLEKYGFTEGWERCRLKQAGLQGARDHSETCRVRIMEAIRQDTSDFGARMKQRHRNEIERMGRRDLHLEESKTQKCWIMDAATMAVKVLQRLRPTRSILQLMML